MATSLNRNKKGKAIISISPMTAQQHPKTSATSPPTSTDTHGFTFLKNLRPHSKKCKIAVGITRKWEVNTTNAVGTDFIGIDFEGGEIHAKISKIIYRKFSDLLQEGNAVIIENFKVIEPRVPYYAPLPQNRYIEFINETSVTRFDGKDDFPEQRFHFVPFCELSSRVGTTTYLTDIIGIITKVEVSDRGTEMTIANELNQSIEAMFWGTSHLIPEELQDSLEEQELIVVMTSAMVKDRKGSLSLNPTLGTRLYFNVDSPEATTLEQSLTQEYRDTPKKRLTYVGDIKKISYIQYMVNKGATESFTCEATVVKIDYSQGWNYLSCGTCKKKLRSISANWCDKCNIQVPSPFLRMRFQLTIEDSTSTMDITCFEEAGIALLGKSREDLLAIETQAGDDSVIRELDTIIGNEFYFRVQMNQQSRMYNQKTFTAHSVVPIEAGPKKRQRTSS